MEGKSEACDDDRVIAPQMKDFRLPRKEAELPEGKLHIPFLIPFLRN